jgi:hypothetical protein
MLLPSVACVLVSVGPSIAADDCGRDDSVRWTARGDQHQTASFNFKYESRVQNGAGPFRKYIWCIENIHDQQVTQFLWGTRDYENRYLEGIAVPGEMIGRYENSSAPIASGLRTIWFRRYGGQHTWESIERETLFPRADALGPLLLAQAGKGDANTGVLPVANFVNLEELSKDRTAFAQYVKEQKEIELFTMVVATIPTSAAVQKAIETTTYEKYIPKDFARIKVGLFNSIAISGEGPVSTISIQVRALTDKDEPHIVEALKEVPIVISIQPDESTSQFLYNELRWEGSLETASLRKKLLHRAAVNLKPVDVILTVGIKGSELKLTRIPAKILVPAKVM